MNSVYFPSHPIQSLHRSTPPLRPHFLSHSIHFNNFSLTHLPFTPTTTPSLRYLCSSSQSNETSPISVLDFEEFVEKDWSFLECDALHALESRSRIISAGEVGAGSRVLVSIGSEEFVDGLVGCCRLGLLLVVHDSLFVLAGIKERYDGVKCWQGEIVYVPDKWAPFDAVFLWFLPALPFELDRIMGALARICSSGARVVISHPQGREVLNQQRKDNPEVVVSDLPDKETLKKVAANNSFALTEYIDEKGFYLAVLKFCKSDFSE
ncbi:hypothetical protein Syun_006395 [Stephania yunnanensis]|uniref:Uncharacterized protein n=1 Tax=Stephania yunnanensis TaxID=152371 RepID=A0AAP0KY65_9MAGN